MKQIDWEVGVIDVLTCAVADIMAGDRAQRNKNVGVEGLHNRADNFIGGRYGRMANGKRPRT